MIRSVQREVSFQCKEAFRNILMSISNDSPSARTETGSGELATLLAFEMSELSDFSART